MPKLTPKNTSWGRDAEWYEGLLNKEGTYQEAVIMPNVKRILELTPGIKVLDSACGVGYFARAFAKEGAVVHGIDAGSSLIEIAKREAGGPEYQVGDATTLAGIEDASFDRVTIILALQNIERANEAIAAAARVLKPTGKLVMVMNHPAFRIPKASSWGWDEETQTQYRREDRYLSELRENIQTHPGSDPDRYTISFHRPLQYYTKACAKAGLAISRLEEWSGHRMSQPGPRAEAENRARAEFPLFVCIECIKIHG
jgi:SAM-dependent methyltransferase